MPACRHCGEDNPERARFCLACGRALAYLCPACGEENPDRAKFCLACGTALGTHTAPVAREVRKTVTIVFCDVAGSTSLGESLDPESLRNVMGRYFGAMQAALERHGGTVEKFIGDAVMAVFGIPVVHEDDALRAVRAAAEMRDARARLNEELERAYGVSIDARIGVNTGEVVAGDSSEGQRFATGDTVNVAARLEQAAPGGEILIGEETHRLVRDAVLVEPVEPLELKGKAARVPAYRLLEVLPSGDAIGRRHDTSLVGRERELRRLGEIFSRVRADPSCWLVTILGAAGLGKSRLVDEFVAGLDGVRTLSGRCLPYGEGITFWPVAEIVRAAAGLEEGDSVDEAVAKVGRLAPDEVSRDRVAAAIGLTEGSGSVEETFWGVRRLLETLAEQQPLIVGFDDIHWAEPTLLDLIEYLSGWIRDLPVLIVCQARPELLEGRPGWGAASNAAVVSLEALTADQSGELIEALVRDTPLTETTRSRILEVSGGNPLFVEQMLAMLGEDGGDTTIPPTIQALLAARLDRLDPEERGVIERASVEGGVFHRSAVGELGGRDALPQLMTLVRRELIRPARSEFTGEDAFSFHHILIRDAAYDSMPKQLRSDLHERFAGWLERTAGDRVREHEEIIGYHLEQAHRFKTELGPADDRARELAARAGTWLLAASRRAEERGDLGAVVNLMGRAAKLVTDGNRLELLPDLGAALVVHGQLEQARALLDEALELGDSTIQGHAELELVTLDLQAGTERDLDEAQQLVERILERFTEAGDELGLLRAYRSLAGVHWVRAHFGKAELALDQAVEYARRVGRRGAGVDSLAWLAMATRFGPTSAADGLRRCDEIFALADGDRNVESTVLIARGGLEAMQGRLDEARAHVEQGRAILDDLGLKLHHAAALQSVGFLELMGGDAATAERHLRDGYDRLTEMRESGFLSTIAAYLARAVYEQGRPEEADALAAEAAQLASPDDLVTHVLSRGVRARILARQGDEAAAAALARSAIELAESTDCLELIGDAHAALADALAAGADHQAAAAELALAIDAFERKGADVLAARLRERPQTAARAGAG